MRAPQQRLDDDVERRKKFRFSLLLAICFYRPIVSPTKNQNKKQLASCLIMRRWKDPIISDGDYYCSTAGAPDTKKFVKFGLRLNDDDRKK